MPQVPQGEQHILHVNVTTQGPAQQGFPILQVTPLGERTGEAVKDMQLAGDMAVKLDLAVPLDKGEQKTRASADVTLRNGQFRLQSRNLQIDAVSADVHFDLENGLSSPAITGKALGGDISGTIDTQPLQQGGQITALNFSGTAQIAALQDWLKLSVLEPLSGTAPYQMEMQIPLGDARQHKHGFINVTSTLQGARVDLPEPFAKTAQRKRDMRVWLSLDRNPSLMSVRYGKLFELSVQSKDGEWQKGNLSLGDQKAVLPVENHFAVTGSVERFSTTEWMAVLSRVQGSAQRYQEPLKSNKLVLLDQSRLDIGEFVLGQTSLGRQQLSCSGRATTGWCKLQAMPSTVPHYCRPIFLPMPTFSRGRPCRWMCRSIASPGPASRRKRRQKRRRKRPRKRFPQQTTGSQWIFRHGCCRRWMLRSGVCSGAMAISVTGP